MAVALESLEFMGGEFMASPNLTPRFYDSGLNKFPPSLRANSFVRKAADLGEVGCNEWQLQPICDPCPTPQVLERRWRALEPTVVDNRVVKWTCTVPDVSPKSSDMSLHCPSEVDGSMSDSFTSTLTAEETDNVNHVMSELAGAFDSSALQALVGPLLDVPGALGTIANDGFSEFEMPLISKFPMISSDFKDANEESNSCESVASEQLSGNLFEVAMGRISADQLPCSFHQELQEGIELGPSPFFFPADHVEPGHHAEKMTGSLSFVVAPRSYCRELDQNESNSSIRNDALFKEKCGMEQMSESQRLLLGSAGTEQQHKDDHESGVELVQLLMACAQATAAGDVSVAQQHIIQLSRLLCSTGSPMERVATYFTEALAERVGMGNRLYGLTGNKANNFGYEEFSLTEQIWIAYQVFYASSPYLIVTHFTANQAILEAFEGEEKVHIVDLDIKQGLQWPSLIQALSLRTGGPPQLRITGVAGAAPDLPSMMATRNRLLEFADMFNVPLEFTILPQSMETLQPWMLKIREHEALAVNCVCSLHQLIEHPRRPLHSFLKMIHSLDPSVVTIVEQDANHCQDFSPRFVDSLHYYSSMFDSLAASLSSSMAEREMVERLLLGEEIINIVGREGDQRFERHQTIEHWNRYMIQAGFHMYPLSPHSVLQAKFLLSMYPVSKFCIINEEGYLSIGWQDKALYAVSCWC